MNEFISKVNENRLIYNCKYTINGSIIFDENLNIVGIHCNMQNEYYTRISMNTFQNNYFNYLKQIGNKY